MLFCGLCKQAMRRLLRKQMPPQMPIPGACSGACSRLQPSHPLAAQLRPMVLLDPKSGIGLPEGAAGANFSADHPVFDVPSSDIHGDHVGPTANQISVIWPSGQSPPSWYSERGSTVIAQLTFPAFSTSAPVFAPVESLLRLIRRY